MAKEHDRHHIKPKSRGGGRRKNLVVLPVTFHRAWHAVFQDLTLEEAHRFMEIVMNSDISWTSKELHYLRERIKDESSES